jgi:hypothetical protein
MVVRSAYVGVVGARHYILILMGADPSSQSRNPPRRCSAPLTPLAVVRYLTMTDEKRIGTMR